MALQAGAAKLKEEEGDEVAVQQGFSAFYYSATGWLMGREVVLCSIPGLYSPEASLHTPHK